MMMHATSHAGRTARAARVVVPALLLVAGCASSAGPSIETPPPTTEPSRPYPVQASEMVAPVDRSTRPMPGEPPVLSLPEPVSMTLANGLGVVVIEKRDIPLVQVNLLVRAGSVLDPQRLPGLASLTADMLDEGAAGKSALEIADAFEMLGARFGVAAGMHHAQLTLRVPVARLEQALAVAADVALRPDFPADELERLRLERLTALIRAHDEPYAIADALAKQALFGPEHPYGRNVTEAALRAVGVNDVRGFWQQWWRPNNATVVVVGDIDPARARALTENAFGGWQQAEVRPQQVAAASQVQGRTVHLVDKPGAAQSVIIIGRIGAARSSPDYYALQVMNTILGGQFTSRLNQNLRETHGYSYGASSSFEFLPAPGPFTAAAAVQTAVTGAALREFFNELEGIRQPIPAEEVERAKNYLAMRYPAQFQSVAGIAAEVGNALLYELPLSTLDETIERVLAVSPVDVERVARQYVDPANVEIIVVGDRTVVEQQIREQNLGDVRVLEVADVLGPVPSLR
ncbi:MAG: insulinase family protein [Candidatus Cloacimonetes bacterium]|jgi:zinc protease|nr:insulinase family protein [Candidatus Cloacimonadota bacterium]